MKFLYVFLLVVSFQLVSFSQEKMQSEKEKEFDPIDGITILKDNIGNEIKNIVDYNAANNIKNGFTAHKSNYILPFTRSDYDKSIEEDSERKKSEIKFQISVKQRLLRFYGWAWYLGYSQKSFWQAYNLDDSRPFRENNFNPETFIRTKMWAGWRFDLGFEHESNGRNVPYSKSWNRIYFTPYFENKYFIFSLKTWYRIPEKDKEYPDDPDGDDNPDINEYYGYGELHLQIKIAKLRLASMFRYNPVHNHGAMQYDFTCPMYTNSMYWFVQYWNGYGESLIDYKVNQQRIGFGIMFTR